jgi:hypothetical protein
MTGDWVPLDTLTAYLRASSSSDATDRTFLKNLPTDATDPNHGGLYLIPRAEAKVFGIVPANASGLDGVIGLNATTLASYSDAHILGILEHEFRQALGAAYTNQGFPTSFNLATYDAATGARTVDDTTSNNVSINGGKTVLGQVNGGMGDGADWTNGTVPNTSPGNLFLYDGINYALSPQDFAVLDMTGFNVKQSGGTRDRIASDHHGHERDHERFRHAQFASRCDGAGERAEHHLFAHA